MGRLLSIIAGIGLINSFYMAWYGFPGITQITPIDVLNYCLTQPITSDIAFKIATMGGIPVLGGLMILTSIFPRLYLSIIKLAIAIGLVFIHVGYFYSTVIQSKTPFEWINIVQTSPGFLLFIGAMALYFVTVVFAILLSPLKGAARLVGL